MNSQSTALFDVDALLAPISSEQPCGDDTRDDASPASPYFSLKDLRHQARALERQQLADEELLPIPQWQQLSRAIPAVLEERSKDLEFVAWYIESLCREAGFNGLAQGFDLARVMIEQHWDQLYPLPDEEGLSSRMAPLVGLNGSDGEGTLVQPILSIPLFFSSALGSFATWHCEQAAEVKRLDGDRAQQRIRTGAASPDAVQQAVGETPIEQLQATSIAIETAIDAWALLTTAMDQVMADNPPPTTHIRKTLERCKSVLMHHAGDRLAAAQAEQDVADQLGDDTGSESGPGSDPAMAPGGGTISGRSESVRVTIASRQQALKQLRQLADFFRQTEPHSPVSYAIGQALRWSELSLPELMQELIEDANARAGFSRITGVPPAETKKP
ncbi:MAG: type VI secretion system protein TssA [Halomonadaceae bacterium]|nr:MAG: type VI secretion system protein TssA [Halomonadaceae bacterium]